MGNNKFIYTHRYGTTEDWKKSKVVPELNEIIIEKYIDNEGKVSRRFKIGDGRNIFNSFKEISKMTKRSMGRWYI